MSARPFDEFLAHFPNAKRRGDSKAKIRCPCHDDQHASADVVESDNGNVLAICRACGADGAAMCMAMKLKPSILFARSTANGNGRHYKPNPRPAKTLSVFSSAEAAISEAGKWCNGAFAGSWVYPGGAFIVARFDLADGRKEFRPIHRTSAGFWVVADPPGLLPLYRGDQIPAVGTIYVVEGEKCADLAATLGLPAVTSSHGADGEKKTDWTPMAGREVVVLPDADKPGEDYAAKVAAILMGLTPPARVKLVRLPDLPPGGDIVEFDAQIAGDAGATKSAIEELVTAAPYVVADDVDDALQDELDGIEAETTADNGDANPAGIFTELGNAQRLAQAHRNDWRFNSNTGTDLIWIGHRFQPDDRGQVLRWAKRSARKLWARAKSAKSMQEARDAANFAIESERSSKLDAATRLARNEPGITVLSADLDADPFLLGHPNGVTDLRTGDFRAGLRTDLITKSTAVDPTDGPCPLWQSVLHRSFAGDADLIGFVQRVMGLALTGDISEQKLFVAYGQGANGKSILLDTIAGILGEYAGQAPDSLVAARRHTEHPTEIAHLDGLRLAIASETEANVELRLQKIKQLTGDEKLIARRMRQDYYMFLRRFKLILVTNNRPRVTEDSEAVWRRILLIPFDVVIPPEERDPHLLKRLRAEWSQILAWMIRGCLEWQRQGLNPPAAVTTATSAYRDDANPLTEYVSDRLVLGPKCRLARNELVQDYASYCVQARDKNPATNSVLYAQIRRLDGVRELTWRPLGNAVQVRGFTGVGLVVNG